MSSPLTSPTTSDTQTPSLHPSNHSSDATQCLFCSAKEASLDDNLSHMLKAHGFSIPEPEYLQVDLETFISYLNLIISGYFQCLYCETQRSSHEAAQQHMIGKSHCKFDLTDPNSELREFYEFGPSANSEDENEGSTNPKAELLLQQQPFVHVNESSIRLPSGKILSDRTIRPHRHHSQRHLDTTVTPSELCETTLSSDSDEAAQLAKPDQSSSGSLRKSERRNVTLGNQLAQLRASDRTSLMHLSPAQQRAQLLVQKRQVDEGKRAQRLMASQVERMGNKTLMKHFVPDVPGRSNG